MNVRGTIQQAPSLVLLKLGVELDAQEVPLEHTDDFAHGDYATGLALRYAKKLDIGSRELAEKIISSLGTLAGVSKIEMAGAGFINFYLSRSVVAGGMSDAREAGKAWGTGDAEK